MPANRLSEDKAREAAEALDRADGNQSRAARSLGINRQTFRDRLKVATARGITPYYDRVGEAPPPLNVKWRTIHYGKDGAVKNVWYRQAKQVEDQAEALREAVAALKHDIPKARPVKAPASTDSELAALYVLTDYHLGQLSWGEETGGDWDIKIAEDLLYNWFGRAIQAAPAADTAILAQLGDLLHYDSLDSITPTNAHLLDADTRFQRVVRVAIRAISRIIQALLQKHRHVHVKMCEGNHDIASSVWMRELFAFHLARVPRVTVDTRPSPYYAFGWGNTALFFHHGHLKRPGNVAATLAGEFRELFGQAAYRYAHTGHKHHIEVKESPLMVVEQHPTLAARDAYNARSGYHSQRGASVILYHREFGEVGRSTIRPEMVSGA